MKKKLFNSAVTITISSFLVKILSIIYKIPYQNLTGDMGFYIYQQLYPLFALFVAYASFALPLAISENKDHKKFYDAIKSTFIIHMFLFSVLSILIIIFNNNLSLYLGDSNLTNVLMPLSILLLLTPILGMMRGILYTDIDKMKYVGFSIVIEQVIRISFILIVLVLIMKRFQLNLYETASISYYGFGIGMLVGIILIFKTINFKFYWQFSFHSKSGFIILKRGLLLLVLSSILLIYYLIDSLTIIQTLSKTFSLSESMIMKGQYDRGLPLIQASIFFVAPLLSSLIPHIEEKNKKAQYGQLIQLILLLALPASIGLCLLMKDINTLFYKTDQLTNVLMLQTVIILLYSLVLTYTAITSKKNSLLMIIISSFVLKYILNNVLISFYHIVGAVYSSIASLLFILIFVIIFNKDQIKYNYMIVFKISVSALFMSLIVTQFNNWNYHFVIVIIIGFISYISSILLLKTVDIKILKGFLNNK